MQKNNKTGWNFFLSVLLLLAVLIFAQPAAAQESRSTETVQAEALGPAVALIAPLATKSVFDWLYVQVSSRGMVVYTRSMAGNDSSVGAVLKTLTWQPRGLEIATLAIGADFGRDGAEKRPITFENLSLYVGAPFNLINVTKPVWSSDSFKRNFSLIKMPKNLEFWYGPGLSIPPGLALSKIRIDRDLRHFVSLAKKFGGGK